MLMNLLADPIVIFGVAMTGVIWAILLLVSLFWIWMLIDCLMSPLPTGEKLIWVVVILFTHILGALIYFLLARGGRKGTGPTTAV